jgi:hypothetical protein
MNAFAMLWVDEALLVANQRSEQLIREAQVHRMAARARAGRRSQIAAAIASIRAAFSGPTTSRETTVVPRLSDYPYRS